MLDEINYIVNFNTNSNNMLTNGGPKITPRSVSCLYLKILFIWAIIHTMHKMILAPVIVHSSTFLNANLSVLTRLPLGRGKCGHSHLLRILSVAKRLATLTC